MLTTGSLVMSLLNTPQASLTPEHQTSITLNILKIFMESPDIAIDTIEPEPVLNLDTHLGFRFPFALPI
jgi:hypothetical protein